MRRRLAPAATRAPAATLIPGAAAFALAAGLVLAGCSSTPDGSGTPDASEGASTAPTAHLEEALHALPAADDTAAVDSFVLTEHTACLPVSGIFYCPLWAWSDTDLGNPFADGADTDPADADLPKGDASPKERRDQIEALPKVEQVELLRSDLTAAIEATPKALGG